LVIWAYRNGRYAEVHAGGESRFNLLQTLADKADMADAPDEHLDVVSSADGVCDVASEGRPTPGGPVAARRLWVGIHFECCGIYKRVYRDPDVPFYEGQCPQCGRKITMRVGPDGLNSRIFKATPI
jgi:hypothetical protein